MCQHENFEIYLPSGFLLDMVSTLCTDFWTSFLRKVQSLWLHVCCEIWPGCISEGLPQPNVFLVWMALWKTEVSWQVTVVTARNDHQRFLNLSFFPSVIWCGHASLSFLELSGTKTYLLHKGKSQPEESCTSNCGTLYIIIFLPQLCVWTDVEISISLIPSVRMMVGKPPFLSKSVSKIHAFETT